MKHHHIITPTYAVVLCVLLTIASGCAKKQPVSGSSQSPVKSAPKGIAFTRWDANKHRIVFLNRDSIKQNLKIYANSFSGTGTDSSMQVQLVTMTSDQFLALLVPTIACFDYGTLDPRAMLHVRAYRASEAGAPTPFPPVPPPTYSSIPTNAMATCPSLRTFTSVEPTVTFGVRDVIAGVQTAPRQKSQVDFATRLDELYTAGGGTTDYVIDGAYLLPGADPVYLESYSATPAVAVFVDPKTGAAKFANYWRLHDAGGHETRITIMLEEP